jgi:hypothetical protein
LDSMPPMGLMAQPISGGHQSLTNFPGDMAT